jgi:predicted ATPase with chaperone activity
MSWNSADWKNLAGSIASFAPTIGWVVKRALDRLISIIDRLDATIARLTMSQAGLEGRVDHQEDICGVACIAARAAVARDLQKERYNG